MRTLVFVVCHCEPVTDVTGVAIPCGNWVAIDVENLI